VPRLFILVLYFRTWFKVL